MLLSISLNTIANSDRYLLPFLGAAQGSVFERLFSELVSLLSPTGFHRPTSSTRAQLLASTAGPDPHRFRNRSVTSGTAFNRRARFFAQHGIDYQRLEKGPTTRIPERLEGSN